MFITILLAVSIIVGEFLALEIVVAFVRHWNRIMRTTIAKELNSNALD